MMNKSSLSRKRITHSIATPIVRTAVICSIAALMASCGSSKPHVITTKAEAKEYQEQIAAVRPARRNITRNTTERPDTEPVEEEPAVEEVPLDMTTVDVAIKTAMNYEGVRYRYGGSTRAGMDCSGLLHISFAEAGETVPRTSMSFFQAATPIDVKEVRKGDLMFFATGRDRKKINHVALVTEVTPAEVRFVHATVSQGVVVSSLNEPYWLGKYRSSGRLF
ncbi:C40 family peptidase [Nonlabens marinus]|uniref:Putative lipoprotein n=1 Tax=Nonlabens marinus S1-08 TaxID=1454201 RepID=W8VVH0_9FLAO|nr:C40 family peptidase [Nonlabens marinus]BAO55438.1 putative lipoprotein [Nonlabens marinus S1-08]